jgi:hypothetical protein
VALVPVTLVMFALSRRFGALAMRIGPRLPMTVGPLVAALGLLLLRAADAHPDYARQVLPGLLVFALGLTMTVAPLTAAVLSSVAPERAGVASGVNNAIARIAGLLAIAVVGAVVSSSFVAALDGKLPPRAIAQARAQPLVTNVPAAVPRGQRARAEATLTDASVHAFRAGLDICALLLAAGGLIAAAGVRNPSPARAASARESAATPTASTR